MNTIKYYAATYNMGEASEQDGDNYRNWAKAEIEKKYPEAKVEVIDGEGRDIADFGEIEDDESALEFLCELWDRCPWTGEFFE